MLTHSAPILVHSHCKLLGVQGCSVKKPLGRCFLGSCIFSVSEAVKLYSLNVLVTHLHIRKDSKVLFSTLFTWVVVREEPEIPS